VKERVILDLCAGTGAWSQPYADAGYTVQRVELDAGQDVRLLPRIKDAVHGILAAPPCTYFCRMRMCRGRPTDEQFREGLSVVDACLRAVVLYKPKWWALENPQGYLKQWLGEPRLKFNPCDYGDPWTKRTWLWGEFAYPKPFPIDPVDSWVRKHVPGGRRQTGLAKTQQERSVTPPGFAYRFFEANP
jgi:hypothetical protein